MAYVRVLIIHIRVWDHVLLIERHFFTSTQNNPVRVGSGYLRIFSLHVFCSQCHTLAVIKYLVLFGKMLLEFESRVLMNEYEGSVQ